MDIRHAAVIALLLSATVHAGTPPKTERLPRGNYIDRAVRESAAALPTDMTVKLVVAIEGAVDTKGVTAADVQAWVNESLRKQLVKDGFKPLEAGADDAATHVLEVQLVEFTPGSSGGRMLAGELGFGVAKLEVKGSLRSAAGETLLRFTDRRSHSGGMGIDDIQGDVGPVLVKKLTAELADDISAEIHTMRKEAPKRRRR
jgi:hypothetical protein